MLNKVMLIGNLGADPELSHHGDQAVLNFRLATTETWGKGAEKKEKSTWHNCVLWGKRAEALANILRKGKQVYVEGRIEINKYDKDGETSSRISVQINCRELHLLGRKGDAPDQEDINF